MFYFHHTSSSSGWFDLETKWLKRGFIEQMYRYLALFLSNSSRLCGNQATDFIRANIL